MLYDRMEPRLFNKRSCKIGVWVVKLFFVVVFVVVCGVGFVVVV